MILIVDYENQRYVVPSFIELERAAHRLAGRFRRFWEWHYRRRWATKNAIPLLACFMGVRCRFDGELCVAYGLTPIEVSRLSWAAYDALRARLAAHRAASTRHEVDSLQAALGCPEERAGAWRRLLAEIDPKYEEVLGYDPVAAGLQFARMRAAFRGNN